MMQLLQEILSTQCTTTPTRISRTSRLPRRLTAIESEVTFSSFMRATMEQMAMISLTIHCPFSSQQSGMDIMPTPNEITSMSRTCLYIFFWQFLLWVSQMASEVHTPTPSAPTTLPRMRAISEVTSGSRQPTVMKRNRQALKMSIALLVISQPTPPQDHALLKSAPRVRIRVVIMISSSSPHSKGLQNQSGLQLTRYSSCPSEVASCTSLICGDAPQRLLSSTVQSEAVQVRLASTGDLSPSTAVIWQPSAWMRQLVWALSGKMQSSGMPQSISLRYWQNCWLRVPSTAIETVPEAVIRVIFWASAPRIVRSRQAVAKMVFMIKYYELSDIVQIYSREDRQSPELTTSSLVIINVSSKFVLEFQVLLIILFSVRMSYSFLFKYIVIGDQSVGKSCLLTQFIERKFKSETDPTIGVEFGSKTFPLKGKTIKLQIWDTAGQEVYRSITRSYYRGTIGAVLVYDITSRGSFNNVLRWIEQTRTYATNDKITIMLVGNKADLAHSRQVSTEDGQTLAEQHGMLFIETSAKTGLNVDPLFETLSETILDKIQKGVLNPRDESGGIKIGLGEPIPLQNRRRLCC